MSRGNEMNGARPLRYTRTLQTERGQVQLQMYYPVLLPHARRELAVFFISMHPCAPTRWVFGVTTGAIRDLCAHLHRPFPRDMAGFLLHAGSGELSRRLSQGATTGSLSPCILDVRDRALIARYVASFERCREHQGPGCPDLPLAPEG